MVLVRFAPSPTGPLHLGGLRMALYNHLFSKKNGGKWILRIEDTDKTRYVPGSVEGIQKALEWAGLNYDYGPGREGPHGPYFQSQRLDLYKGYASKLIESGHAYRCFCTPDTLATVKEKLARSGASASYDRRCLHLTEEEAARKVRAGEKHTIRFNVRASCTTALPSREPTQDLIFRSLRDAHQSLATDPILLKSDLFPTYHLASIVDDHEMGITHVLRGEEWITSLPLHQDLYAALKLPPPTFAHFPILLNPDGSKMSKRHGDIRVEDFIKRGWEPDAVLNWLLLCGYGVRTSSSQDKGNSKVSAHDQQAHHLESNTVMNLDEMVDVFDISHITQRNTILEAANLHYINKHHLMRKMKNETELKKLVEIANLKLLEKFPSR
ncbi:hypothetical protein CPB83DRAFT_767702 [Crepidotus variabilis]|uniref:Glutamate--tRNA ligase, mitochondrial n=1 Tax=Crepidotus variabilis TaxID=179855 RepID=A0A9P6EEA4_9AGAR|nr:hypothetical protein CPB83DRAFT_767702 [Crepidotus variabilis]